VSPDKITLTRAELYEKVWTTPMRTLAKEFGLSDVGLAKLCRRHNIPLPGRGHWARIQFGQKVEREALPASEETRLGTIEIWPREPRHTRKSESKDELPIPTIEVADGRQITHSVVRRIDNSISRSRKDERGILLTRQGRVVPFRVSAEALPRALRILDALFSALDEHKYTIEWPKPYNTLLTIVSDGEKLQLLITEAIERREHKPTVEEVARQKRDYWWHPPRWDYSSTGRLRLTLESVEFSQLHSSWSDGKRRKLETCVGEILVECERMAPAVKRAREAKAEAERRWAEERKREAEAAIRRAEYERRAEAVKKLSEAWQQSTLIKEFAIALQTVTAAADIPDDARKELEAMIDWTARHAAYVDPLTDLNCTLRQFKNPPWHYGN